MKDKSDQDSVWKEAIETYLKDFLVFFFPQIASDIELERGYDFLDKELKRALREAKTGKRYADVLVKVYLKDGQERWLLIHIEVQGYYEEGFAERMFIYNYRIFDRYREEVISLAILADSVLTFRPERYEVARWGFRQLFEYPMVKLTDYRSRWEELEKSDNPFAIIVMAHLKEMETKKDIKNRLFWKITLVKRLYEKGFKKENILLLYKFIDLLISLPEKKNETFHEEISRFEEGKKMPYITTAERIGIKKGKQEGKQEAIQDVLEIRFETVPSNLIEKIKGITSEKALSALLKKAILVKELDEFEQIMNKSLN